MKEAKLFDRIQALYSELRAKMWKEHKRHVSFGDLMTDRWETAKSYGFGEGASCYDNVLVLGEVKVGKHTWIGPNVILDGTGGLEIGDYCSISAGVQIYTHDTVRWANSLGKEGIEHAATRIGSGVYIGPQCVIQKGVEIGDKAVIGAMSFVNTNIPEGARAWGLPAIVRS